MPSDGQKFPFGAEIRIPSEYSRRLLFSPAQPRRAKTRLSAGKAAEPKVLKEPFSGVTTDLAGHATAPIFCCLVQRAEPSRSQPLWWMGRDLPVLGRAAWHGGHSLGFLRRRPFQTARSLFDRSSRATSSRGHRVQVVRLSSSSFPGVSPL